MTVQLKTVQPMNVHPTFTGRKTGTIVKLDRHQVLMTCTVLLNRGILKVSLHVPMII